MTCLAPFLDLNRELLVCAIVALAYALFRMAADGMCTDLQGC